VIEQEHITAVIATIKDNFNAFIKCNDYSP
jgi:hypothetical protein